MVLHATSYASGVVHKGILVVTILPEQIRDSEPAYSLRDEIISLVDASKPSSILLDMERVHFIGSVGLLAFLGVRRHFGDGRIVLCNVSDGIRRLFAACRLISTDAAKSAPFEVESTVEATLGRLGD